ncbi:polysaccharide deacetylase family protein [Ramlibacter rhizophilus]|uniref:Polysaccharide deacetylase family protein n=1 Tax=Ramlibacter rhizophilus TaxID=1781167 RepID=A0A4Z0BFQ1_9BURK|nr:polysaccharide deacetylase family protein [Ramlibacter rhizophilus]TFY97283.1 polysaccharide deacetylase family protein [Ramlibacter rhizophilus]
MSRRAPIPILSYHQTDGAPPGRLPHRSFVLPPARFARQMRALRRLGWTGLSMRELEPYLRGERQGKVVGITLDDGYLNNLQHAMPVLRELGFTATSFVVSQRIGASNDWDAGKGIPGVPLMDAVQLRAWMDAGMEVGAHTRHHVDLLTCDEERAREEIAGSKQELEQLLGCEVRSFCFPYGRYREPHVEMARQAGFATATTSESERAAEGCDLLCLPRISVLRDSSLPMLLARVATGYEDWRRSLGRQARPLLRSWRAQPAP